jgi:hypothetical protein
MKKKRRNDRAERYAKRRCVSYRARVSAEKKVMRKEKGEEKKYDTHY